MKCTYREDYTSEGIDIHASGENQLITSGKEFLWGLVHPRRGDRKITIHVVYFSTNELIDADIGYDCAIVVRDENVRLPQKIRILERRHGMERHTGYRLPWKCPFSCTNANPHAISFT
jgi:hypothetical protein